MELYIFFNLPLAFICFICYSGLSLQAHLISFAFYCNNRAIAHLFDCFSLFYKHLWLLSHFQALRYSLGHREKQDRLCPQGMESHRPNTSAAQILSDEWGWWGVNPLCKNWMHVAQILMPHCTHFLLLHNKLPLTPWLIKTCVYCLRVSVGWEPGHNLSESSARGPTVQQSRCGPGCVPFWSLAVLLQVHMMVVGLRSHLNMLAVSWGLLSGPRSHRVSCLVAFIDASQHSCSLQGQQENLSLLRACPPYTHLVDSSQDLRISSTERR